MKFLFILFLSLPYSVWANVVGVDSQNFNPTTSGLDFVTVHSSKTLSPGIMNFGLFFNYAINTLPNYEDTLTQDRFEPKDSLLALDLNMGLGLMENWDVGISIPQILKQTVDQDTTAFHGVFEQTGLTEIRLNSKYRFWEGLSQGLAVIGSMNIYLIEDFPFTGTSPGPTYNLELAYDNTFDKITWGVNVGYRLRNPGDAVAGIPVQPFDDQYIGSVAGSYYFSDWDLKIIGEVYGAIPAQEVEFTSDRNQSVAELLIGAKWDMVYNIAAHAGMGTEIIHGTASPDWRFYAGLNWAIGPVFSTQAPISTEEPKTYTETPVAPTYIDAPEAFSKPSPQNNEMFMAKNILFEFNGTTVRQDFYADLQKFSEYLLKGNAFKELIVIGHTDSVGSDEYNLNLSLRRAQSVSEVIRSYLPPEHREKVRAQGEGERSPIVSNENFQDRALNRRVEFFVKRDNASILVPTNPSAASQPQAPQNTMPQSNGPKQKGAPHSPVAPAAPVVPAAPAMPAAPASSAAPAVPAAPVAPVQPAPAKQAPASSLKPPEQTGGKYNPTNGGNAPQSSTPTPPAPPRFPKPGKN
jgi:outer membrane protein OmpA-like peptidoglycan-associated protein